MYLMKFKKNQNKEKTAMAKELRKEQEEAEKIRKKISVMERKIFQMPCQENIHYL